MEAERTVTYTYFAESVVKRDGEGVRLDLRLPGSSIRELAEHLVVQASELESKTKEKLEQTEIEKAKKQRAELSGRRRRSWE
ncbi:MAG: hypothetical protein H6Q33_1824 [Deltaproteobacteria bacterium]|jgi:hypothetical protein|nr:hypothetical protein [Deltaproteobacteria bacterium]